MHLIHIIQVCRLLIQPKQQKIQRCFHLEMGGPDPQKDSIPLDPFRLRTRSIGPVPPYPVRWNG